MLEHGTSPIPEQPPRAQVYPLCQSLPQLLHHKRRVARSLLGRLGVADTVQPVALLDLTTHLARDLRAEFWPFFPDTVRAISSVLNR